MKRGIGVAVFVVLCIVQWAVPASMIVRREMTLWYGQSYRFKTAPIDPYDAFRGRYVWLSFEDRSASVAAEQLFERGDTAYVTIATDEEGFALLDRAFHRPPAEPYLTMKVSYAYEAESVDLEWPIDRFYMEETIAPRAEQAYRDATVDGEQVVYAGIRVSNGWAVLENLFVDGIPIAQYVEQNPVP